VVVLLYLAFLGIGYIGTRLGLLAAGAPFPSVDLVTALLVPCLALWLVLAGVYIVYFTHAGGRTPGKMLMGIRVVGADDADPTWSQAALRPLGYLLSLLPLGLGFLMAAVPPGKRALHDLLTGTRVVLTNPDDAATAPPAFLRPVLFASALGLCAIGAFALPASATLVERIVAVANDHLVTASDLTAYQTLFAPEGESSDRAVQTLVERKLLLDEADRFAVGAPDEAAVARRVAAAEQRLGGAREVDQALERLGWDRADLRAWIVEDLRIAEFLDQRIYFFVLISPEDVAAYHESHHDEYPALTPEEAREAITKRLTQERGDEKQHHFVAALRAKATIRINPPIAAEEPAVTQPAR
jgi:uncharacterized RDD family membrane protein YckC